MSKPRVYRQPRGVWVAEIAGVKWFFESHSEALRWVADRASWKLRSAMAV